MKKMLKEDSIIFIVLIALLSIFSFNVYKYLLNFNNQREQELEIKNECKQNPPTDLERKEFCMEVEEQPLPKLDFYSMFFSTFAQGYHSITFIIFLLIIIPTVLKMNRFLKNNSFKNYLSRQSYKKTISNLLLNSSKSVLILPILTIIAFVVCYLCTGNFDYENALQGGYVTWSQETMTNPFIFALTYIFRIFLLSILYVNIAICVCKKNHNFFISTIISYLLFLGIEIFLEVFCNMIISNIIFKSDFGVVFNILSIFSLFDYYGLVYSILIPIIFVLISMYIVYSKYKDKEKIIIECEKNE